MKLKDRVNMFKKILFLLIGVITICGSIIIITMLKKQKEIINKEYMRLENIQKNNKNNKNNNSEKNIKNSTDNKSDKSLKKIIELKSEEEFKKEIEQNNDGKKRIVIFSQEWCGYCTMMKKDLTKLLSDGYLIYSVDLSSLSFELIEKYEAFRVPTTVIIQNGKEVSKIIGYTQYILLKDWIEKYIK